METKKVKLGRYDKRLRNVLKTHMKLILEDPKLTTEEKQRELNIIQIMIEAGEAHIHEEMSVQSPDVER